MRHLSLYQARYIKRNRISASGLRFTEPNLTFLIEEIQREWLMKDE